MDQEINEGRGCGPNKDYVLLKLSHLGAETIHKRLPSVYEIGVNFANVDITRQDIPVVPTIHYQMGGIPTNIHGQVVVTPGRQRRPEDRPRRPVRGRRMRLRLGAWRQPPGHQLAARPAGVRPRRRQPHRRELRRQGRVQAAAGRRHRQDPGAPGDRLDASTERRIRAQDVATTCARPCSSTAGVFRTQANGRRRQEDQRDARARVANITLKDKSKVFNTARIEALEVDNLIEAGQATMTSAAARHECRGAHTVNDATTRPARRRRGPLGRDDKEWMKHTLWWSRSSKARLDLQARSTCR